MGCRRIAQERRAKDVKVKRGGRKVTVVEGCHCLRRREKKFMCQSREIARVNINRKEKGVNVFSRIGNESLSLCRNLRVDNKVGKKKKGEGGKRAFFLPIRGEEDRHASPWGEEKKVVEETRT